MDVRVDKIEYYSGSREPAEKIIGKVERDGFSRATKLLPANIMPLLDSEIGSNHVKRHFSLTFMEQAALLREALSDLNQFDRRILDGIYTTPRHHLLPGSRAALAYWNGVNTVRGTIALTPPWLTAYAAHRLGIGEDARVLVLGYGYGYASIAFSRIVGISGQIIAVEIDEDLVRAGRQMLKYLGIENLEVVHGDALSLPPDLGRFDAIWPTLSVREVPEQWWLSLRQYGKMGLFVPLTNLEFDKNDKLTEIYGRSYNDYLNDNWWLNLKLQFVSSGADYNNVATTMYGLFNPPMEKVGGEALDVSHWYKSTYNAENTVLSALLEYVR